MPAYEIVLRKDEADEVRLTDRPPKVGEKIRMAGAEWIVERAQRPRERFASRRFICRRT